MTDYCRAISRHYEKVWSASGSVVDFSKGPIRELPSEFRVARFEPTRRRRLWTYATVGMSQPSDALRLELFMVANRRMDFDIAEVLFAVAHYHRTAHPLGLGHTVNFGRGWADDSRCTHALVSLPYLDGPVLENAEAAGRQVRFLWLVPITPAEKDYVHLHGQSALEDLFEQSGFDYADPGRPALVE